MRHFIFLLLCMSCAATAAPRHQFLCEDSTRDIFPDDRLYCEAMQNFRKGFDAHALKLFKRASRYGNKMAQYKVGLMYAGGVGVQQDEIEGAAWLMLANERNVDEITDRLRFVMSTLPEFEKRRARARAAELQAEYGDLVSLERRAQWVRRMKHKMTGSRLGRPMAAVRTVGSSGLTSDQHLARLDAYEASLRETVTTVEYRDFRVLDVDSEATPESR